MLNKLNLIIGAVLLMVFVSAGLYVRHLNNQVVKCKANTSIQKERYEREKESYDSAILEITEYYDSKEKDISKFKRKDNETDCQASKRFLDNASY